MNVDLCGFGHDSESATLLLSIIAPLAFLNVKGEKDMRWLESLNTLQGISKSRQGPIVDYEGLSDFLFFQSGW